MYYSVSCSKTRKNESNVKQKQLRRKKRRAVLKRRMKSLTMKKYGSKFQ